MRLDPKDVRVWAAHGPVAQEFLRYFGQELWKRNTYLKKTNKQTNITNAGSFLHKQEKWAAELFSGEMHVASSVVVTSFCLCSTKPSELPTDPDRNPAILFGGMGKPYLDMCVLDYGSFDSSSSESGFDSWATN